MSQAQRQDVWQRLHFPFRLWVYEHHRVRSEASPHLEFQVVLVTKALCMMVSGMTRYERYAGHSVYVV